MTTPLAALIASATEDDLRELANALAPYVTTPEVGPVYLPAAEYARRYDKTTDAVTAAFRRGSLPGIKRGPRNPGAAFNDVIRNARFGRPTDPTREWNP